MYNLVPTCLLSLLFLLAFTNAIQFDLPPATSAVIDSYNAAKQEAVTSGRPLPTGLGGIGRRCLGLQISRDTLVVANYIVGGPEIGQQIDVSVTDQRGNLYYKKNNVHGDYKVSFNTPKDAALEEDDYDFCFTNTMTEVNTPHHDSTPKSIALFLRVGPDAIDYNEVAKVEKMKPVELKLKKIEEEVYHIVDELEFMKKREAAMRDTNESTCGRVQWFSLLSMSVLIGVGVFQVAYLKKYFEKKKLI